MTKERDSKMKLIVNDSVNTYEQKTASDESSESKVYQSDPLKTELYSKLLAYRQSQKKFNVLDLIRDSLK